MRPCAAISRSSACREESIYGTVVLGYTNAAHRNAAPRKEERIRILR